MTKPIFGGKPLRYEHPKELISIIQKYLDETPFEEYSVTGLALRVGGKQLLQDYEKREGYGEAIREAKLIIENSYELALRKQGGVHNIFALKNFGWRDKQETEISGKEGGPIEQSITLSFVDGRSENADDVQDSIPTV